MKDFKKQLKDKKDFLLNERGRGASPKPYHHRPLQVEDLYPDTSSRWLKRGITTQSRLKAISSAEGYETRFAGVMCAGRLEIEEGMELSTKRTARHVGPCERI